MRDIVFVLVFIVLVFFSIRRPFISLTIWLWSGLFVPFYWLYGFASSISYNSIAAFLTIGGYIVRGNKAKFKINLLFVLVIAFFIHTTITSITTITIPALAWQTWNNFFKAILFFLFSCLIVRKQHHFNLFLWAIVLSVGFLGFVEGLKFIASGGGHHIKGPNGNLLSDNNHMAAALCMTLPFIIYLSSVTKEKVLLIGLRVMLVICIIAVIGTYSRGGLVGLVIVGGYFWLKSKHKFGSLILILTVCLIAYNYIPNNWYNRMDTIENAMQDHSFSTRVVSWKIHTLMAMERPILGGGFKACEYGYIWRGLAANFDKLSFIPTPPAGDKGWAAHSIYFQVLGDHGFVGLFLFLAMIVVSFMRLTAVEKHYSSLGKEEDWRCRLSKMVKVSLAAYCITGAAVSLAYLEMFYAILSLVVCLDLNRQEELKK